MGAITKATSQQVISPAQSTAITFTDDHGDEITITSNDVRMHICPQADAKEVAYFMELCRAQRLNPFLNEAYLVKFAGKPAQIMVAHKALVKRAEAHPQYDGMEHGVVVMRNGEIHHEQRGAVYTEAGEKLIGGWCKVYRKDRRMPIYAERSLKAMDKGQANWKVMPDVMIDKCAQAAALREAFPDELRAMYVREEMGSVPAQEVTPDEVTAPPESATHLYQKPSVTPKEDISWLKDATAKLVELGYVESDVKAYLWNLYKTEGIDKAKAWYDSQIAQQTAQEPESQAVADDAANYTEDAVIEPEIGSEVELADEDIDFG